MKKNENKKDRPTIELPQKALSYLAGELDSFPFTYSGVALESSYEVAQRILETLIADHGAFFERSSPPKISARDRRKRLISSR